MKKLVAVVLLTSAALACGAKKESTTPNKEAPLEQPRDATGGATYGGSDASQPDAANPCAPK